MKTKEKQLYRRKPCLVEAGECLLGGREEHRKEHCPRRRGSLGGRGVCGCQGLFTKAHWGLWGLVDFNGSLTVSAG